VTGPNHWCGRGDSFTLTGREASGRVTEDVLERHAGGVVRKGGLEPPRYCYRQPLKLVRLPIPPLPLRREGGPRRPTSFNTRAKAGLPILPATAPASAAVAAVPAAAPRAAAAPAPRALREPSARAALAPPAGLVRR
jgi:hypothetical protein